MRIERFSADDMSHAMRGVRASLGADAVILSNHRVGDKVEILAAVDYDESLLGGMGAVKGPVERTPVVALGTLELQNELKALKTSLEEEIGRLRQGRAVLTEAETPHGVVGRRLESLGFASDVVAAVLRRLPDDMGRVPSFGESLKLLGGLLRPRTDDLLETGGVVALLGATGVGKTTTAAKLAAQFAFRHGKEEVALVTTDSFRVGGHEQLRAYARVLGVPLEIASNATELSSRLRHLRKRKLVIVDTAGMGQRDVQLARQLQTIVGGASGIKGYLVLSCTSQAGIVQEITRAFSKVPLHSAIITKTDEALSLGPVLSGVIRARLPVAYLCNGQGVPEDIESASRQSLLALCRDMASASRPTGAMRRVAGEF
ncbi:MAG: flagellar biosynthesis protein FlhF [Pseudomonadota bacterium]